MLRAADAQPPETVADLFEALRPLGDIPPKRIRLHPTPGTATEEDLLRVLDRENRICELIDGTLVEKVMGFQESAIAALLIHRLLNYLDQRNLGIVTGADGTLKLTTGLIRIPDVTFVRWENLPGGQFPDQPIPRLTIDLAVEVISQGNTRAEMQRKLREYFAAGTRLVWFLYPKDRTARIYTTPRRGTKLAQDDALDGGDVLPGFRLPLRELFNRATRGPRG